MLCTDNLNLPTLVALILSNDLDITIVGLVLSKDTTIVGLVFSKDTTIVGLVLPHVRKGRRIELVV